jgi:hypothetical protein
MLDSNTRKQQVDMIDGEDLIVRPDRRFSCIQSFKDVEKILFVMECLTFVLIPIGDIPILQINGPHIILTPPPDLSTFNGGGGGLEWWFPHSGPPNVAPPHDFRPPLSNPYHLPPPPLIILQNTNHTATLPTTHLSSTHTPTTAQLSPPCSPDYSPYHLSPPRNPHPLVSSPIGHFPPRLPP